MTQSDLNKALENRRKAEKNMNSPISIVRSDSDDDLYYADGNDFPPDPLNLVPSLSAARREKK